MEKVNYGVYGVVSLELLSYLVGLLCLEYYIELWSCYVELLCPEY